MPSDHYISRVYLKKFGTPENRDLMYVILKKTMIKFKDSTRHQCASQNGSTNFYLAKERIVEEFLKEIEPKYDIVLNKIKDGVIDSECIFVISGLIAYIQTCSPTAMRLNSVPLKTTAEIYALAMDASGQLPLPPRGIESFSELLKSRGLTINVDEKYSQAIGINMILDLINNLGNSNWDILFNPFKNIPFFTSDFPIAIEKVRGRIGINKIFPLSTELAVRINSHFPMPKKQSYDFTFADFRFRTQELKKSEVCRINKLIVRCAESAVYFSDDHRWIPKFVGKNAAYHIEQTVTCFPSIEGGKVLLTYLEIVKTQ